MKPQEKKKGGGASGVCTNPPTDLNFLPSTLPYRPKKKKKISRKRKEKEKRQQP